MNSPSPAADPRRRLVRRPGGELVGTGLLVAVLIGSGIAAVRQSPHDVALQLLETRVATVIGRAVLAAPALGAWIGAAYWFTSSTSFANPAVTIGRVFANTFAGMAPGSVAPFVAALALGGVLGVAAVVGLYPTGAREHAPVAEPTAEALTAWIPA